MEVLRVICDLAKVSATIEATMMKAIGQHMTMIAMRKLRSIVSRYIEMQRVDVLLTQRDLVRVTNDC